MKTAPRSMPTVLTLGFKVRYQGYPGAPLRKSEWSAWCDLEKKEG